MKKRGVTRQKISGSVSIFRKVNILSKAQSEAIMEMLQQGSPSTWVTIIRDTRDGGFQVWPTEDTEGEPLYAFKPLKGKSTPASK